MQTHGGKMDHIRTLKELATYLDEAKPYDKKTTIIYVSPELYKYFEKKLRTPLLATESITFNNVRIKETPLLTKGNIYIIKEDEKCLQ
jgi:hypothetical protein